MTSIIIGSLLIVLALVMVALQRFYSSVPARELKRLTRRGDHLAAALYRPVAFGASMRALVWATVTITLAIGFLLIIPQIHPVLGFVVLVTVLALAFVWLPSLRLTISMARFAAKLSPLLTAVVSFLYPLLNRITTLVNNSRDFYHHSKLYEKDDLTDLLKRQKEQADNRISLQELELAERALHFSDRHAADIVQPRKSTFLVNADDSIGPIVLDQLHQSGQSSFLVYKDEPENIIGVLRMRDAIDAKHGGQVMDLMRNDVCFVHEDFSLRQVLTAFQQTGQHTLVVINTFEEFVGVITFRQLLQELVGEAATDDENYENRSLIANFKARRQAREQEAAQAAAAEQDSPEPTEETEQTSPEATGVVK